MNNNTILTWNDYFKKYKENKIAVHFSKLARKKICFKLDKLLFSKNHIKKIKILDFGTSDSSNDDANPFLKHLLNKKKKYKIYGSGLDSIFKVKKKFKHINYSIIKPLKKLPFKDNYFYASISHAVFEHVGNDKCFMFYLNELLRVSNKVFISIPNRYFIVEHHSNIPFLGFMPSTFIYKLFKILDYKIFKDENTLTFNSQKSLESKLKLIKNKYKYKFNLGYTGLNMGIFSSHIYIYANKKFK